MNQVTTIPESLPVNNNGGGLAQQYSVNEFNERRKIILAVMNQNMKSNVDFGKIPGCGDKPTLLKPGAEKLNSIFGLNPRFEINVDDQGNEHKNYNIVCNIYSIASGAFLGSGVGSASTMESKYRFRTNFTGAAVPQEYWNTKDKNLLGGPHFDIRKVKGQWQIIEKVEHDNPADYYNTVLKMAKKRALIDATLTVTAASDLFTQDLEDEIFSGSQDYADKKMNQQPAQQPQSAPKKQSKSEISQEEIDDYFIELLNKNYKKLEELSGVNFGPAGYADGNDLILPLSNFLKGNINETAMNKTKKDEDKFLTAFAEFIKKDNG